MLDKFNLLDGVVALKAFSVETRRALHQIPELSGEETKTSRYCRDIFEQLGYKVTMYQGYTGFIADLECASADSRIAFRADMDALEMPDMTENEYRSKHEGKAHNCGHDTHMAIALTAAKYLSQHQEQLKHHVRFIFQMAEEDARIPGADKMVELGCMDGVDEVYALHNNAALEYGEIEINDQIMSSYGKIWSLDIQGKSAHGSTPQKGLDAIREGARIVADMDYIVAKQTNPFSPAVFVCGMFNGGTVPNSVADNVQARGTIRSLDAETDTILTESFQSLVKQSELRGFKTQITHCGYPAVINHSEAYQRVLNVASETVPKAYINAFCKPMTASEDFSLMINATKNRKGAMFFLGTGNKEKGIQNYLHSNPYYVEDNALVVGAQIFIKLATSA